MKNQLGLKIATLILWVLLLAVGFVLAEHRPLWNDEVYSQLSSVENLSVKRILTGRISEGNTCPLFYLIQKGICRVSNYKAPSVWQASNPDWGFSTSRDRFVLRISSVISIATTMAAIFYFFSRFYSLPTGLYGLFLSLSTAVLWGYWAEARHYALWFFLTTLQVLILTYIFKEKKLKRNLCVALSTVHILLSLTIVFSLAQIVIASALLWIFCERRWRPYVILTGIPATICLFYYSTAPHYAFWIMFSIEQYIREGIARDRIYIIEMYVFFLALYYAFRRRRPFSCLYRDEEILAGAPYLLLVLGMMLSVVATFLLFERMERPNHEGFPVTTRYFIHLAPVGIVATTLFTRTLFRTLGKNAWARMFLSLVIASIIIPQLPKVARDIAGYYPQLIISLKMFLRIGITQ
jgi:hypothetical protein